MRDSPNNPSVDDTDVPFRVDHRLWIVGHRNDRLTFRIPGTKQRCTVGQPAQGAVALYFLFTQPGLQWKKLLSMPFKNKYNIDLKANSQIDIYETKSWFSWF